MEQNYIIKLLILFSCRLGDQCPSWQRIDRKQLLLIPAMKTKLPIINVTKTSLSSRTFKFLFGMMLLLQLSGQSAFSQTHVNADVIPVEILTKSIMHQELWKESTLSINDVNTIYILNHGVKALNDLPLNLKLNNKPVILINKSDIGTLGNTPHFLFHTLNVEESKAFIRIYMSYLFNGERRTSNLEIAFVKNNGDWEIN